MKRIAIKLVVFLLLGAVVNVGVAWGCAVASTHDFMSGVAKPDSASPHYELLLLGAGTGIESELSVRWRRGGTTTMQMTFLSVTIYSEYGRGWIDTTGGSGMPVAPRRRLDGALGAFGPEWTVSSALRVGWPLLCLNSEQTATYKRPAFVGPTGLRAYQHESRWAWRLPGKQVGLTSDAVIPLEPIFPGFFINTLFYAVILCLLWSTPFVARRLIRKRRGRCVHCGYDLRHAEHDVCPECGR